MSRLFYYNSTAFEWVAWPRSLGRSMILSCSLVFDYSFGRWLLACSWVDVVQLVGAFDIVFAIIFLSGSRRNHSLKRQMTTHPYRTSTRIACARDHLDSLDHYAFYSTSMEDPLHYWDHSSWRITQLLVKDQIGEVDVEVPRVRLYYV